MSVRSRSWDPGFISERYALAKAERLTAIPTMTTTRSRRALSDEDMDSQKLSDSPTSIPEDSRPERRIQLDLSPAQVAGGALAAATAAALSSGLGVAGTIAGAAVISLVTAVAGTLYTQSLRRTRTHVRAAAALVTARRGGIGPGPAAAQPAGRIALRPRRLVAGGLVVFCLAVAGITGFELITGHPLSGGAAGTTLGELTRTGPEGGSGRDDQPPPGQERTTDPDPAEDSDAPTTEPVDPSTAESSTTVPSTTSPAPSSPSPTSPPGPSPAPTPGP